MSEDRTPPEQPSFDVPSIEEMASYLPQFKFEKMAACGGMGAVYKAYQESLDRWVAVKILPPKFGEEKEFVERFKSEARTMAKLNHTNIVGVYDFGITPGGHLYLVMEWIEGRSLHDLIHKTNLPVRKATNLAMQLCEALSFAHEHGIIHRDIKPGNIMVNDADHVKVADFGLARPSNETEEDNPMGTPDYAAPEIRGGSVTDHRVDIFAAGVVLYEMLAGRVPEQPRRPITLFAKVSPRWDEIVAKAVHPDPEKRYQDAGEFRAHINAAMKQEAGIVLPDALDAKPKVLVPKKKAPAMSQKQQMMLTFGFAGLVLVALLALVFWPASRRSVAVSTAGAGVEAAPEEVHDVLQNLEKNDAELAKLVNSFAQDWEASGAGRAPAVAEKLRAAQMAAVKAKAKDRLEAARRAEVVATELEKLKEAPSLKALQQAAAR
jgi:serine/threonine protein kinase